VKKIYILIREKKGKTTEERFKELFNDSVSKYCFVIILFAHGVVQWTF